MPATARSIPALRCSLQAADALARQADASTDPALQRLLLKSSCDVLLHSLEESPPAPRVHEAAGRAA